MKFILSLIITVLVLSTPLLAVEYGTLVSQPSGQYQISSEKITLHEGDILEVKGVIGDGNSWRLVLKDSRLPAGFWYAQGNDVLANAELLNITRDFDFYRFFVGPAEIFITQTETDPGNSFYRVSYKLTRASEVEYKNVNIISLPSSTVGAGSHEIVVEASEDLQTWTPVHSSSIGGNKAFFRTRVVEAGD